jgi:hypothetical protein
MDPEDQGPLGRLGSMAADAYRAVAAPVRRAFNPPPQRVVPETTGMASHVQNRLDTPTQYLDSPQNFYERGAMEIQEPTSVGTPRDQQPLRRLDGPSGLAVVANPDTGILERDARVMSPEDQDRIGASRRGLGRAQQAAAYNLGLDPERLTAAGRAAIFVPSLYHLLRRGIQGDEAYHRDYTTPYARTAPPQSAHAPQQATPDNLFEDDRRALQGIMNEMHDGNIGLDEARRTTQAIGNIVRGYQGTFDEAAFLDELERIARVREGAEQRRSRVAQRNQAADERARENIRNRR